MSNLLKDLKYGIRMLRKNPGFTAVTALVLALGIGANTAIFSVVNSVVFRPLSFADPERLMVVMDRRGEAANLSPVAPANYEDTRSRTRLFEELAAAEAWHGIFTGDGAAERVQGLRVTANLFPMLGARPLLGRTFAKEEEEAGRHRVILLSYGLWQRRFGGDAGIVGRTVHLSGQSFEVAGVMPHDFAFPPFWASKAEMWAPLAFDAERRSSRGGSSLRLFGRLRPGVALVQAQAEMNAIAAGLAQEFPEANKNRSVGVRPLYEMVVGDVRQSLLLLSGAVGFLLLIACCNVANLLLARSLKRQREMAVRAALGASRWRITRQLLAESVVISLLGGLVGVILAYWGMDALLALLQDARSQNVTELPRLREIALDTDALLFTLGISLLTGVLFGLAPAFHAVRLAVGESLKESALSASGSIRGGRLRNALVISEVALTVVLLAGAGLMIRSFIKLLQVDPGFEPNRVLSATVSVTGTSVEQPERHADFYRELLEQVRSLPDVLSVAAINHLPLAGDRWSTSYVVQGRPETSPADRPNAIYRMISPGYFRTMGTTLLRGRDFNPQDTAKAEKVVIVNDTFAKMLSPGEAVLGMRIRTGGSPEWQTIVGVAENVRQKDWVEETSAEIYLPFFQHPSHFGGVASSSMTLVVRTSGGLQAVLRALENAVWSVDRNIPVHNVTTLDQVVRDSVSQPRFYTALLAIFAGTATLLAAMGIYGVISYSVAQRTREIGIRVALGAARRDVLAMVVGHGMRMAAIGLFAGFLASLLTNRALSGLLYGVSPADPLAMSVVILLLAAVAFVASYIPALRAARLDPMKALRFE